MFDVEAELRVELLDFILKPLCIIKSVLESGSKIFTERIRKTDGIMPGNLEQLGRRHLAIRKKQEYGLGNER